MKQKIFVTSRDFYGKSYTWLKDSDEEEVFFIEAWFFYLSKKDFEKYDEDKRAIEDEVFFIEMIQDE